jgi:hypothetical protein
MERVLARRRLGAVGSVWPTPRDLCRGQKSTDVCVARSVASAWRHARSHSSNVAVVTQTATALFFPHR